MAISGNSSKAALKQLVENLQCAICKQLPKNAHICPKCSEMYCYECIRSFLSFQVNRCAECSERLNVNELVKLRCFENLEETNTVLIQRMCSASSSSPTGESHELIATNQQHSELEETDQESTQIAVGRQEPVANLPAAVHGTFTLRNFARCRIPWVFSERVVDELGFVWRMKVSPRGLRNEYPDMMGVYVEMLYGEVGFYEIMLELLNIKPIAFLIKTRLDTESYVGKERFINTQTLPRGNYHLQFRYTIRPASYQAKSHILQRLLDNRKQRMQLLSGKSETFVYTISHFASIDLDQLSCEYITDQFQSRWRFGPQTTNQFAEFHLTLLDYQPGIYAVELVLTHPIPGCEKRISYERNVEINQKNLFNFQMQWNRLEEYGYTEPLGHIVVEYTIRPIYLNVRQLQTMITSESGEEEEFDD